MKNIFKCFCLALLLIIPFSINVNAIDKTVYVNLNKLEYSLDGSTYKSIAEYKKLEDFLKDYNANNLSEIYITDFLFDGVSTVKIYDLDDYIEEDSNDIKVKSLDIK